MIHATRRSDLPTFALAAAGAASGGGAFVVGKLAVADLSPTTIAALRYSLALVVFIALVLVEGRPWPRPAARDWLLLAGMGISAVAGYNLLFLEGLKHAPAAEGGLIVPGSAPIFLALLTPLLFRELPSSRTWAGIALASAGLALLLAGRGLADTTSRHRVGEALYLAGGLCWALFFSCARALHGRIHSLIANTYAAAIGLLVLIPVALLSPGLGELARIRPNALAEIAYLAVFATVLLLWANVRAVERLGAVRVAPLSYVAPVAAVIGAALFLGERPSAFQLAGGALALLGTWLATHRPETSEPARAEPEAATS